MFGTFFRRRAVPDLHDRAAKFVGFWAQEGSDQAMLARILVHAAERTAEAAGPSGSFIELLNTRPPDQIEAAKVFAAKVSKRHFDDRDTHLAITADAYAVVHLLCELPDLPPESRQFGRLASNVYAACLTTIRTDRSESA